MTASVTWLISPAADLHPVEVAQVRLDVADREPAAVERQDLVVKPFKAPLALSDDLRLKAPVAVPRRGARPARARSTASWASSPLRVFPHATRRLPVAAHSRDGRSARPPSRAPPAAWSAGSTTRPVRRSPPRSPHQPTARRSARRELRAQIVLHRSQSRARRRPRSAARCSETGASPDSTGRRRLAYRLRRRHTIKDPRSNI